MLLSICRIITPAIAPTMHIGTFRITDGGSP